MIRIISSKDVRASQPSSSRAFAGFASKVSTSAGRWNSGSMRTKSCGSSPTWAKQTSTQSRTECWRPVPIT